MAVPDAYQGREQSYVKHVLLKSYLEKLFHIIGVSSKRIGITELCYVDCFAGPWSSDTATLADTSIGISLEALENCRQQLAKLDVSLRIRALYIEKDVSAFSKLEKFLSTRPSSDIEARCLNGDFVAMQSQILDWCGKNSFSFFFIDPTGWKEVAVAALVPLLQRRQSEFLINFMYDFVNRTASMPDWKEPIATLLGESLDLTDLDPSEREDRLISTYRTNLKAKMSSTGKLYPRSAYVRVLDRKKERPKYHLIYLTTHPRGIIEFMEASEKVDLIQKHVRASTKQAERAIKTGIDDMFADDVYVDQQQGHAVPYRVQQYLLAYLANGPKRVDESEFANLLETTNWLPEDFQSALKILIDEGKIRNLDAPRKRPKKPLHWKNGGERLQLVEGDL